MIPGARPPRLAEALLRVVLAREDREEVLGDLHEDFVRRADQENPASARRAYWKEVAGSMVPSLRRRLETGGDPSAKAGAIARSLSPSIVFSEARQAMRVLRRRPGLLASAVLTLGVGIGAATSIFTLVDAALLRPLPYPEPDRLVSIWNVYESWEGDSVLGAYWDRMTLSYPEYERLRDGSSTLESVAIYGSSTMALIGSGDPEQVVVGFASPSLFGLLGAEPAMGRGFSPTEAGGAAAELAVLSHELWETRMGRDPGALGRTVTLDGASYEVIGVLPPGFRLRTLSGFATADGRHDVWLPVGAAGSPLNEDSRSYESLARLAPGASAEQASAEARPLLAAGSDTRGAKVVSRQEEEVGDSARFLAQLLGGVVLLLLITCGNVAALLIGDLTSRAREISTRAALGAGRGRIVRQLLVESGLLGLAGAVVGFAVARFVVPVLGRLAPPELPIPADLSPDLRVFLITAGAGLLVGVAFGLLAALLLDRSNRMEGLRSHGRMGVRTGRTTQRLVVSGQLATAMVLLTTMGLLVRSLRAELSVDPGFRASDLLTARVSLPESRYAGSPEVTVFLGRAVERLAAIPGVSDVTATTGLPFSGEGGSNSFEIVGRVGPTDQKLPEADRRSVLPGFHRTLGNEVVRGRSLEHADASGPPVVVLSESLVRQYWPSGDDPLGGRIRFGGVDVDWEVVGVVGDLLHDELSGQPRPTFYLPLSHDEAARSLALVLRTELPASDVIPSLRNAMASLDPELPLEDLTTMSALISRTTRADRYRASLIALFAVSALILASVGVFAVTARGVSLQAREMGVRIALGAPRRALARRVVAQETTWLAGGLLMGALGAAGASLLLRSALFGVSPGDPVSLVLAASALTLAGVTASWLAARRATRLQPMDVIRAD